MVVLVESAVLAERQQLVSQVLAEMLVLAVLVVQADTVLQLVIRPMVLTAVTLGQVLLVV